MLMKFFCAFLMMGLLIMIGCEGNDPVSSVLETEPSQSAEASWDESTIADLECFGRWKCKNAIRVMTRNVYVGADLDKVLAAEDPNDIPVLAAEAFQTLIDTNFPERAEAFAKEIKQADPHLIGLQEISTIYTQIPGDAVVGGTTPASDVAYDFLEILMATFNAYGLPYKVVGKIKNIDVEVPMVVNPSPLEFGDVRLIDYDVVLARKDVRTCKVLEKTYWASLPVPTFGIEINRGFVAVDATIGKTTIRFASTHLESLPPHDSPYYNSVLQLQKVQAQELVTLLKSQKKPVVAVGDFNTPAPYGETYQYIQSEGFMDIWTRNLLNDNPDGFTSNHDANLCNEIVDLDERIDLIFVRNKAGYSHHQVFGPVYAYVVGDEPQDRTTNGLWPSDHAGVVACLHLHPLGWSAYK
jgi:hypothetical protein